MKYRLTTLIILLTLALASCSLAEDITPPPGYQSPTPMATQVPATLTPQPTRQTEPAAATTEPAATTTLASPEGPLPITPSADVTAAAVAPLGNIIGNLINESGGSIPAGQNVTLDGYDIDQSGNYQKTMELVSPVDPKGSFSFIGVEMPQGRVFLAFTSWGGVEYQSDPLAVSSATTDYSISLSIYDKTDDLTLLAFSQIHLIFNLSSQNVLEVTELFIVTNPSKQVVVVSSDGTTIPFINIPKNASSVQYQLSQGSAQLLNAEGGFAMVPGAEKQYGFLASYTMPYNRSLKFDQPFSMPVSSLTVFIPQGMRLRSEQLTDSGPQDIQGQTYQMYQANTIASGSSLSLTLSGKAGASTGFLFTRQTWVLIGICAVGLLLIGLGITLYLRDRARLKQEIESEQEVIEEDALGEDRDSIMDAMIALDDQYKSGEIPKEAYETRRMELKERLKGVL
jgi:hypothetical protein